MSRRDDNKKKNIYLGVFELTFYENVWGTNYTKDYKFSISYCQYYFKTLFATTFTVFHSIIFLFFTAMFVISFLNT